MSPASMKTSSMTSLLYDNPVTDSFDTSNGANMAAFGVEAHIDWQPVDNLHLSTTSSMKADYYDPIAAHPKPAGGPAWPV